MSGGHDAEHFAHWALQPGPGGPLGCLPSDAPALAVARQILPGLVEIPRTGWLRAIVRDHRWRGLLLQVTEAELATEPGAATTLRNSLTGPLVIRLTETAAGARETWDGRFIAAGWLRHPLVLTAVGFTNLENERDSVLLAYLPLTPAQLTDHPLATLAAERNLHMDMLREAGRRSDAHLARYTWALDFIRPHDVVVDAACGLGYGSALLRAGSRCARVQGYDLSSSAVSYARALYGKGWKGLDFAEQDLAGKLPLSDDSVDCFVSFETFEHLADPAAFIREIHRVLKPGGRLLCSVPNWWADETGRDPSPFHLQTFDLPRLLALCAKFRIEVVAGEAAGGSDPRFSAGRRLSALDPSAAGREADRQGVEWWLLSAMKDPLPAQSQPYAETVFPGLERPPGIGRFNNGYRNPWLVHPLVHIPFRLKGPAALRKMAEETAAVHPPGSADHGAALAVQAYQTLSGGPAAARQGLISKVRAHLAQPPHAVHEHRWQISLSFVLAQLLLAENRPTEAQEAFARCAECDFRSFAPHIATKTAEAAFQAGRLALLAGNFDGARLHFERGLEIGRLLAAQPFEQVLIDPREPHLHGCGDGMREFVLAFDSVTRSANGIAVLAQYERTGTANILDLERSWQWEVAHLASILRNAQSESESRFQQTELLTDRLRVVEGQPAVLEGQIQRLIERVRTLEPDLNARAAQIHTLVATVQRLEIELANREKQSETLTELARRHEAESAARIEQIEVLTRLAKQHETESAERAGQIGTLNGLAREYQSVIAAQTERIAELERIARDRLAETVREQSAARDLRAEMALAAQLLGRIAALPVSAPIRWLQLPLPAAIAPDVAMRCHFETREFTPNLVRITGWGFALAGNATPLDAPLLAFKSPNALWVLRGAGIDRADVDEAFPQESSPAARKRSGFVFEFHPGMLPGPDLREATVICGQVAGVPVATPPFSLP